MYPKTKSKSSGQNGKIARTKALSEQWDKLAQLKGRQADKENNRLSANLSFPDFRVEYRLEVSAGPGGVRVSINLDKPLVTRAITITSPTAVSET